MKKLTEEQIQSQAWALGIEAAALKAVIEVECKGLGFNADNTPVILFERHVMRQRLIANDQSKVVDQMMIKRPDLCSRSAGGYGLYSAQHGRLNAAAQYHRASALESASWGIGQVMGYHWARLGCTDALDLQKRMSESEGQQLDVFCRFILTDTALHQALQQRKWAEFARRYNGAAYKENLYDVKLARAYEQLSATYKTAELQPEEESTNA